MKPSNLMKQLTAIGLAAAMAGLAATAVQAAPAAKTIRVLSAAGVDAASPEAEVWKKAPVTQVSLQPAFPGHGSIVGTPVTERLAAQAVRAGDRLYVKLAWSDRTVNTAIKDTVQFVDGAAVQFPVNGKAATTPFMGDAKNPVNVWHWRADGHTENLVAKGFGTSTSVPFEGLKSAAVRTDSGWAVVLTRSLKVKPDEGVSLQGRKSIPVAFAAWDGANQERDGLKAVTLEWWQLRF
ncbi:MAG: chlorate reductase subunit gamma [Rhodocyclaceae bacterium]|jgi:complex iron-sulfur molybdoenzyme family reductase subunit gamma|nr:chlorate reductase subunit gamma [Rhodocyclaceae bacterium]